MLVASRPRAISVSLKPPVGGLDYRSSLAAMPPENAIHLTNWFPDIEGVYPRGGYTSHATGLGAAVETILEYSGVDGTNEIFGCASTNIYDVTSSGAVGAAVVASMTNARWQQVQISTPGGHFLIAFNGADTPRTYDGTTWSTFGATGPTVANLIWGTTHQKRLWFGEKDSLDIWYLAVNAITGAATVFPLGGIAKRGGFIMAMGSWTRDAGDGMDDIAVFVTSEGEAIVYAGTDPSSASTWALVGVFRVGRPVGRRCMIKAGTDLLITTEAGFVAMSQILILDPAQADKAALSKQVNDRIVLLVGIYGAEFGWQPFLYPAGKMLFLNMSTSAESVGPYQQFIFNVETGAPTLFNDIPSKCWGLKGSTPFFGDNVGEVFEFDTHDNGDDGSDTTATGITAFNHFGSRGTNKAFKLVEIIYDITGTIIVAADKDPAIDFWVDYNIGTSTGVATTLSEYTAPTTPTGRKIARGWRGIRGIGRSGAVQVVQKTLKGGPYLKGGPVWLETGIIYVPGGRI